MVLDSPQESAGNILSNRKFLAYQCVVVCSKDCRAIVVTESPIPFLVVG